ncbi:MAG TPA: hypothetical protein VJ577_00140 [Burkholderiaceae bacterium]|nr:hypothetical protein [Burkholderiaceae bacterium]
MHKDSAKLVLYKTNFEGNSICGTGIAKAMQSGMIDKKRFRKERVGKLCGIDLMTPGVARVRKMGGQGPALPDGMGRGWCDRLGAS